MDPLLAHICVQRHVNVLKMHGRDLLLRLDVHIIDTEKEGELAGLSLLFFVRISVTLDIPRKLYSYAVSELLNDFFNH